MATPTPRQPIDISSLIRDAEDKRAQAKIEAQQSQRAAEIKSTLDKKSRSIKAQADNKYQYARTLETALNNYEGQLEAYVTKLSRGDKLTEVEQKDFDRVVKQYNSVNTTYNKTISEGNAILAKLPETPTGPTGPDAGVTGTTATGTTGVTGAAPTSLSFEEFIKGIDSDPKLLAKVRADLGIKSTDPKLDIVTYNALVTKEREIVTLEGIRGPIDRLTYFAETRGRGTGDVPTTTISPVADATVYINNAFKRSGINRDATVQEITSLTKVLNDAENRFKKSTKGGVTKDLLGDRTQFITNLITTGKYVDPNTGKTIKGVQKDVLDAAKVLGTLSKSAQVLKADTRSLTVQTLQSTANANGITLSPQQLDQYALDIQNGKDVKVIQSQIRNLAGLGMPDSVKKLLAEGTDLDTIYSPYRQTMAAVLELNPTTISFTDPVLRSAIGPNGEVPLYDFQRALRKDARWQYTDNAKADVFAGVKEVFSNFGIMEI
jgi:hypothetical protein